MSHLKAAETKEKKIKKRTYARGLIYIKGNKMKINKLNVMLVSFCLFISLISESQSADTTKESLAEARLGKAHEKRYDINKDINNPLQVELVPTGSVMQFAGEIAPSGWLLCDGKRYLDIEYPKLYEVIGTKYIPDGSDALVFNRMSPDKQYFHVPNLNRDVEQEDPIVPLTPPQMTASQTLEDRRAAARARKLEALKAKRALGSAALIAPQPRDIYLNYIIKY